MKIILWLGEVHHNLRNCIPQEKEVFYFEWKMDFFHMIYSVYGSPLPWSSQILPTHPDPHLLLFFLIIRQPGTQENKNKNHKTRQNKANLNMTK